MELKFQEWLEKNALHESQRFSREDIRKGVEGLFSEIDRLTFEVARWRFVKSLASMDYDWRFSTNLRIEKFSSGDFEKDVDFAMEQAEKENPSKVPAA